MHTLKNGDKAYFDSFAGMIPCKVIGIDKQITSPVRVQARITENHGPYRRGEIVMSHSRIVPRSAVTFRKFGTFVQAFQIDGE